MIRRSVHLVMVIATLCAATPVFAQARDARTTASMSAPTGTAMISGVVTTADGSARPLRLANVVLIGAMTGVLKVTSTDPDGKFTFRDLPADRYAVGASKPPFIGAVAGARRPARPGTAVNVANGQHVTDVAIRLPMGAAISGTIFDEFGQPARAIVVVQQRRMQNGERVLVTVGGNTQTDERGRYRAYGLVPGDYVVSAMRLGGYPAAPRVLVDADVDRALRGDQVSEPTGPVAPASRPVPIFYPGSARPDEAGTISLASGDERDNIDIRVDRVVSVNVDGFVTTADGMVPANANVVLMSGAGSGPSSSAMGGRVGPDGRFSFSSVTPGPYVMTAILGGPTQQFASTSIDVSGADVSGVRLVLRPPLSMPGRIVFDGAAAPTLAGLAVPVNGLSNNPAQGVSAPGVRPSVSASAADGTFVIKDMLPGRFVFGGKMYFGANDTSVNWSLQSVTADGKDITDRAIEITADSLPKEIVVTISDKSQSVSGRLTQSSGAPATDYTVVVFPADTSYWLTGSRRIVTATPDSNGQFTLGGTGITSLPAGEYLLAAVTEIGRDEQFDPALLTSLIGAAVPLSIKPGERKVQDLVIR